MATTQGERALPQSGDTRLGDRQTGSTQPGNPQSLAQQSTPQRTPDLGGIAASGQAGVADAIERSSERRDDDGTPAATTGEGVGQNAPRLDLGGTAEPGRGPGQTGASSTSGGATSTRSSNASTTVSRSPGSDPDTSVASGGRRSFDDEDEDEWSTPRATAPADQPPNESAVDSLGRAVGEVLTGNDDESRGGKR